MSVSRAAEDFTDWEALLALILRSFAFMEGRIDPPSSAHLLTPAALRGKAQAEALFLAHAPTLAGCVFCAPQADALYIGKLAVDPAHQGRGLGRALIAAADGHARALGLPRLRLQTRIELTENHAAFARMGFLETGRSAHPGFDHPTSITMERPVAPAPAAPISPP